MSKRTFAPAAVVSALALVMAIALGAPAVGSQATPEADDEAAIALHPAHIHDGTCGDLGDVVYPLNDLQAAVGVASPEASTGADTSATPQAVPGDIVAQSGTEVEVSLDELVSGDFAVNVHESPENIQNFIACGDITGSPTDGELTIDLQELNDSGYVGEAHFSDGGDGTTAVSVALFPSDVTGTPVATPAS